MRARASKTEGLTSKNTSPSRRGLGMPLTVWELLVWTVCVMNKD